MRCGCPRCGAFMIHEEAGTHCVCPECLTRCDACQGTGTALTHEEVERMKSGEELTRVTEIESDFDAVDEEETIEANEALAAPENPDRYYD